MQRRKFFYIIGALESKQADGPPVGKIKPTTIDTKYVCDALLSIGSDGFWMHKFKG